MLAEGHGAAEIDEASAGLPYAAGSLAPIEPVDCWQDAEAAAVTQSSPPSTAGETVDLAGIEAAPSPDERQESALSSGNTLDTDTAAQETQSDKESRRELETAVSCTSQLTPTPGHGDDEESIEAYMARLLKRVRGDAVADAFVIQQTAIGSMPVIAGAEPARQTAAPADPAQAESQEFLPRKTAPEQAADVAAMRELAVQSTRQAIDHSSQLRYQRNSLATTLGACALMGLSVALFGWGFDTGNWLAWSGAGVCLLGAAYLTARRMKLRRTATAM
jgi:hypothetical protein